MLTSVMSLTSADVDSITEHNLRQETGREYLQFTLFGGALTNSKTFNDLYEQIPGLRKRFFDAPNTFFPKKQICELEKKIIKKFLFLLIHPREKIDSSNQDLEQTKSHIEQLQLIIKNRNFTEEEAYKEQLMYLYKIKGMNIDIFFSREISLIYNAYQALNLDYANLIADAFSIDCSINSLRLHTNFASNEAGTGHSQYMEILCKKENNAIKATIKIIESGKNLRSHCLKANRKLRKIFSGHRFKEKNITLHEIKHLSLFLQSQLNFDCDLFTNAFLYLKCQTGIAPEDIRNYYLLHKTMQFMVDKGVVYRPLNIPETNFYRAVPTTTQRVYINMIKKMGDYQRHELNNASGPLMYFIKQSVFSFFGNKLIELVSRDLDFIMNMVKERPIIWATIKTH